MSTTALFPLDTIQHLERAFYSASLSGWKPTEVQQQQAVALVDFVSTPVRELFLQCLFGVSNCTDCGRTLRIQRVHAGWDFQMWCGTEDCPRFDSALLNIELKPWGAPPHYSVAELPVWKERIDQGYLVRLSTYHEPTDTCGLGKCSSKCKHSNYRRNPTLPQVIVPCADGVDRLLLTDLTGDLSTIYGTRGWGYAIVGVEVRSISDGIAAASHALVGKLGTMTPEDRRILTLATTGLWIRTPPVEFIRLSTADEVRALLMVDLLGAADAYAAAHTQPRPIA